ncbi:MAG: FAD-dependent oxidoreductase [Pseudomonadota bacterium]
MTKPLSPADAVPESDDGSSAFPYLTDAQIDQIAKIANERTFADGEALWEIGDRNASFYVIRNGAVDIRQRLHDGDCVTIVQHKERGFTGDVDLLSGKSAVVEGRAHGAVSALEVCPERLRRLVVADSGLSDVILTAFFARRQALLAAGLGNLMLLGSRYSQNTFRIREFLERNSRPFRWVDLDADEDAAALLEGFGVAIEDTPVVVSADGDIYRNPGIEDMARCLGLSAVNDDRIHDVIVVGAGPAGLAASVYAASEGLDVVALDAVAPGGQASTSSKIENYLGFPTGISGRELAQRAQVQAEKFGAALSAPRGALSLDCSCPNTYKIDVGDGESVRGRAVVIASGAQYRRLPLAQAERFEGQGVYFGATAMEARLCAGEEVIVIGGGNSAGQAAVYLSGHAKHVHVMVRSEGLERTMSKYLIDRIDALGNTTLHTYTEVSNIFGEDRLERIETHCKKTGEKTLRDIRNLFVFIGAAPNTDWLNGCVALDEKGFVITGRDIPESELDAEKWLDHRPSLLETSLPRIFAAGDIRSGSTKRVASAVGEGSISVQFIHQALAR